MSDRPENPPAFPNPDLVMPNGDFEHGQSGLTMRDYFAAKAMQGMLSCQDFMNDQIIKFGITKEQALENVARWAYIQADAMLKQRNA